MQSPWTKVLLLGTFDETESEIWDGLGQLSCVAKTPFRHYERSHRCIAHHYIVILFSVLCYAVLMKRNLRFEMAGSVPKFSYLYKRQKRCCKSTYVYCFVSYKLQLYRLCRPKWAFCTLLKIEIITYRRTYILWLCKHGGIASWSVSLYPVKCYGRINAWVDPVCKLKTCAKKRWRKLANKFTLPLS